MQSESDLVVGELRSRVGIELNVGPSQELSVELDAVVGGIIIIEQSCLAYRRP